MSARSISLQILLAAAAACLASAQTAPADPAPAPAAAPQPERPEPAENAYRIGPGDVLQISVWKEPEVSIAAVAVRPDGNISVPVVKEVYATGLTPAELERELAARLSRFVHAPEVTVVVKEVHSKKIYLIGGVKREGPLPLDAPMTVLQAIAEAGGLTEYAKRKKIYLLRTEDGRQLRIAFDYEAVIRGERMEQNIEVRSGDTIVVPQ